MNVVILTKVSEIYISLVVNEEHEDITNGTTKETNCLSCSIGICMVSVCLLSQRGYSKYFRLLIVLLLPKPFVD